MKGNKNYKTYSRKRTIQMKKAKHQVIENSICDNHFVNNGTTKRKLTLNQEPAAQSKLKILEVFSIKSQNSSLQLLIKAEPDLELVDLLPNCPKTGDQIQETIEIPDDNILEENHLVTDSSDNSDPTPETALKSSKKPKTNTSKPTRDPVTVAFECKRCKRFFKTKFSLKCHNQLKHEVNCYKCFSCQNQYRTEFHRDEHFMADHINNKTTKISSHSY